MNITKISASVPSDALWIYESGLIPAMISTSSLIMTQANYAWRNLFNSMDLPVPCSLTRVFASVENGGDILKFIADGFRVAGSSSSIGFSVQSKEYLGKFKLILLSNEGLIEPNEDDQSLKNNANLALPFLPIVSRPDFRVLVVFEDLSSTLRLQKRLTQDEFYDRQTGLYNRRTLDIILEREIEKAQRDDAKAGFALLLVELLNMENFKSLYPLAIISHVLEHCANAIRGAIRNNDLLFRFDENRILVFVDSYKLSTDLLIIAERIGDQIAVPFHTNDASLHVDSAIGISVFPDDGKDMDVLLRNASVALTYALENNLSHLMFNVELNKRAEDRLFLRSSLSQAVINDEFELRYMHLVNNEGVICGLEALIRWRHPQRGMIGPDVFLPVAVHSRMIGTITRWVLYKVIAEWESYFNKHDIFITINLSAQDFSDEYFIDMFLVAIRDRLPAKNIKVEITESECFNNKEKAIHAMHVLNDNGIEVLIDDFGTGYSSLTYLRDLPVQWVKIDRSFLKGIEDSEKEREFLKYLLQMIAVRGIKILVEGIETQEQYQIIKRLGADLFQGHYFSPPLERDRMLQCLAEPDPRVCWSGS